MNATLVIPKSLVEELHDLAAHPVETAGVLLVSVVTLGDGCLRLLGREFIAVRDSAYLRRVEDALSISSDGYVDALGRAESIGAAALWIHTHPGSGGLPISSPHDDVVDGHLAEPFRLRSGNDYYGALILSPRNDGFAFSGYVEAAGGNRVAINRIWMVGDRFKLIASVEAHAVPPREMFDRNVRALGPAIQSTLGDLTIGVVGCGGTGSAVAEQLTRLGIRKFVLIDPDVLSASNVTRVYGSAPADVGRKKVEVVADHIRHIAPNAACETVGSMLTIARVAKRLLSVDLVFGCTDDNAGRLVLSRIPTYLLTPVIDCGVLISSEVAGRITGIDARVTVVGPEEACLLCRGRIDIARAGAELLTPAERRRLEAEGYAPGLGPIEPAVVTFTTLAAATAVSELLERLIGYGREPRPGEVLLRCHEREISTNVAMPRPGHYCSETSGKLGMGVTDPFLELAWTA